MCQNNINIMIIIVMYYTKVILLETSNQKQDGLYLYKTVFQIGRSHMPNLKECMCLVC